MSQRGMILSSSEKVGTKHWAETEAETLLKAIGKEKRKEALSIIKLALIKASLRYVGGRAE